MKTCLKCNKPIDEEGKNKYAIISNSTFLSKNKYLTYPFKIERFINI